MTDTDLTAPDDTPEPLPLYPVWKQAAQEAVAAFGYGDLIPMEWVRDRLEIADLDETARLTVKQHRDLAFDLLRKTEMFKQVMLEQHKRYLVTVRGCGYKVIEPPRQTAAATRKFMQVFHKQYHQTLTALVNINEAALNLEDARENAEAKMKLQHLKMMAGQTLGDDNQIASPAPALPDDNHD